MKHSQVRSSISILIKCCFVLIALFVNSCSNKHQAISITAQPVFSEQDSSVTSFGNTVLDKYDYFLVSGYLLDKKKLKKIINEFVDKYPREKEIHYNNYLMFFYKNSGSVNEHVIMKTEEKYRYKIFTYNKEDDYIGCITYRDSTKTFVNWNGEIE
jgi:hypothetical protein